MLHFKTQITVTCEQAPDLKLRSVREWFYAHQLDYSLRWDDGEGDREYRVGPFWPRIGQCRYLPTSSFDVNAVDPEEETVFVGDQCVIVVRDYHGHDIVWIYTDHAEEAWDQDGHMYLSSAWPGRLPKEDRKIRSDIPTW
jgi:hypothetical protein